MDKFIGARTTNETCRTITPTRVVKRKNKNVKRQRERRIAAALVEKGSQAIDHALRWRSTDGDEGDDKDDDSCRSVDRMSSRDGVHERPPVLRGETGA